MTPLVSALVLMALLLAGCGGSAARPDTATSPTSPPGSSAPAGEPGSPAPTTPATAAETAPPEGPGAVPEEAGSELGAAERRLTRLRIPYRVQPRTPGAEPTNLWKVCETNPAARTHLESGSGVFLIVAPVC